MSRRAKPALDELEAALGYRFTNRSLLEQALTHVSAVANNNRGGSYQRLEFLGDRVLGLAIADLLYRVYPGEDEGAMSRRLSDLVRKETCAEIATAWGIGPHLTLGPSESHTGGRKRMTILGDACEAIIGAVYLDAGYQVAHDMVQAAWRDRAMVTVAARRDAKTDLQEWGQARGLKTPVYETVSRSGPDHAPVFVVSANIETLEPALGKGNSKRMAEQAAAETFLRREGVWTEENGNG